MQEDDRAYWDDRAATLGRRAGGHIDIEKYHYEEKLRRKAFNRLVDVHPGMRALDVGAGVGNWCFWFEEAGAQVVGIDISARMVDMAKQEANRRHSSVQFIASAIEDFDFGSEPFDLITAITVLQHITDDARCRTAVKKMARLIRKGGYVVVCENLWSGKGARGDSYTRRRTKSELTRTFADEGCLIRGDTGVVFVGHELHDAYCRFRTRLARALKQRPEVPATTLGAHSPTGSTMSPPTFASLRGTELRAVLACASVIDRVSGHLGLVPARYAHTTMMAFERE